MHVDSYASRPRRPEGVRRAALAAVIVWAALTGGSILLMTQAGPHHWIAFLDGAMLTAVTLALLTGRRTRT